jgi:hypothetical protein
VNLLEAAFAVAIVAILSGATLQAAVTATHAAAGDPIRDALQSQAADESRIALDVLKYAGGTVVPKAVATTIPLPAGTPLPVNIAVATGALPDGAIGVTVTAADPADPAESASVTTRLESRAPIPGSMQAAPGLVPAPTGAP